MAPASRQAGLLDDAAMTHVLPLCSSLFAARLIIYRASCARVENKKYLLKENVEITCLQPLSRGALSLESLDVFLPRKPEIMLCC